MLRKLSFYSMGAILIIAVTLVAGVGNPPSQEFGQRPDKTAIQPKATFTVTSNLDTGAPGELRWAIQQANANPGYDIIDFNIVPSGPQMIMPNSQLPLLTDPAGVFIDGFTQPGGATAGAAPPNTAILLIEINGIAAGYAHGLYIVSDNNMIHGLIINNFERDGIRIEGNPAYNPQASFNQIYSCFIGTDGPGLADVGNGRAMDALYAGVHIKNVPDGFAFENIVDGCLVSGNYAEGVAIIGPQVPGDVYSNHVHNSYIGTDITGTMDLGNDHEGVEMAEGTHDNDVVNNLICGNDWDGVGLQGYDNIPYPPAPPIYTHRNFVTDNYIGIDYGMNPLPNGMAGVAIGEYGPGQWGFACTTTVANNVIAYNGADGVVVWEHSLNTNNADQNTISTNSIFDNAGLGIDLDNDGVTPNDAGDPDMLANDDMNFPVITSAVYAAGGSTVSGTCEIAASNVEVFKARLDPTGYGEGETFLGFAALDGMGNWTLTTTLLNPGDSVTATATDNSLNTSEFSGTIAVSSGPTPWDCEENPPPGKLGGGFEQEPNDNCATANQAACERAYCGDINPAGEADWWTITLPSDTCYCMHVRVFADQTPGQYAFGGGLDPELRVYASDCTTQLFYNDDYNGTFPDAVGTDSEWDCNDPNNCHQPGETLYIRISTGGDGSTWGPYLLVINCYECECPDTTLDTCDYYKAPYNDYSPYGMPDFDQKQDQWYIGIPPAQQWTHCGPVALANCLWWFDSKYDSCTATWPTICDSYQLLWGLGAWDDHDTSNVMPFVDSLALYCQTNTGGKSGTNVFNLANGAQNWINNAGLAGTYTVNVYPVDGAPFGFEDIRNEVLISQDVILLLGFYQEVEPGLCERAGGHFATVAGTCTNPLDSALCISDPYFDANEGEPPAGSAHGSNVHNDAQYVSGPHGTIHHDRYNVVPTTCTPMWPPNWVVELSNYPITPTNVVPFIGLNEQDNNGSITPVPGLPMHTVIEYAIVICPVEPDPDQDGWPDPLDNCPNIYNPDQANSDADSLGDVCDNCTLIANDDQANSDTDTLGNACDNCDLVDNNDQTNSDTDTLGNACDNCDLVDNNDQTNSDTDTLGNACDNCDLVDNNDQTNSDTDTLGNACDNCDLVDNNDQTNSDTDTLGNACDNCDLVDNNDQANSDTDTLGNACDNCDLVDNNDQANNDTDTLGNVCDNCPDDDNNDQADSDGDGIGDVCDTGTCCNHDGIRGDVNYNMAGPNIQDLTYLVAYLFGGGATPPCLPEADVNGNSAGPNIQDLTYLVAYLFGGGPAPAPC